MKKLIPYLLAVVVFLVVLVLLRPAPQTKVVVAASDLPAGHVLIEADLELRALPKDTLPDTYLTAPTQAAGQALVVDRSKGDLILPGHLGPESVLLQPDERAVAINVIDSTGMAGLLKPGDLIGVNAILFSQGQAESGAFSKATIENLRVLYVSPSFKADDPAQSAGTVITPDPSTGIAVQRERTKEGTVVLAVPVKAMTITYDFSSVDPNVPNTSRSVNTIELLSALDAADNARLTLYLMPKDAKPFTSSGLWLPSLVITPGPMPTPTETSTGQPNAAAGTPVPTLKP